VRLVAVVAVLIGVVVLQGPRCSDGMIAAMALGIHAASPVAADVPAADCGPTMTMTAVITSPQHTAARCTADHPPGDPARGASHSSGLDDPRGVLGSCLALVVTVLAAIAAVDLRWIRSKTRVCAVGLHAPNLTQLCLLRI
jgi:hypothetical protein